MTVPVNICIIIVFLAVSNHRFVYWGESDSDFDNGGLTVYYIVFLSVSNHRFVYWGESDLNFENGRILRVCLNNSDGHPEGTEIVANAGNPNAICVDGKVDPPPICPSNCVFLLKCTKTTVYVTSAGVTDISLATPWQRTLGSKQIHSLRLLEVASTRPPIHGRASAHGHHRTVER